MTDDEVLNDLFYNKKNMDGIAQLYKKAKIVHPKITIKIVKTWYDLQNVNNITKKEVGSKFYLPIYSDLPYSFQIDLTFFPRYTSYNKGYYVLFTAININTRFVYAYYGKNKERDTILNFLKEMESKTIINSITCDEGKEFKNNEFIKYCTDNNIYLYFIKDDSHKLGIINRFHRTLKEKLTKYFLANDTVRWYNVIDSIIDNYNRSFNRGIGIEPIKVNAFLENEIINYKKDQTKIIKETIKLFEIGDIVLIKNKVELFQDKMRSTYSKKHYTITKVTTNSLIIVDSKGEESKIKKSEVLKIKPDAIPENEEDIIEKVNKKNKSKNKFKREGLDETNIIVGRTRSQRI